MKPVLIVPTFGLVVALAGLSAGLDARRTFAEPVEAQEAAPSPKRPGRGPGGQPHPRERAASASHWWNDPMLVEELVLTGAQREKMDSYFDAHRKRASEANRTTLTAFNAALAAGDFEKARALLKPLSDEAGMPIRSLGEFKIELISALSDEQRKTLFEKHPRLINQLGMRRGRRRPPGPRRGPGGKPRTGMQGGG
jgi:Spy/CpxP family protein refolding chaperone